MIQEIGEWQGPLTLVEPFYTFPDTIDLFGTPAQMHAFKTEVYTDWGDGGILAQQAVYRLLRAAQTNEYGHLIANGASLLVYLKVTKEGGQLHAIEYRIYYTATDTSELLLPVRSAGDGFFPGKIVNYERISAIAARMNGQN